MPLAERRGGAESALLQLLEHGSGLGFEWRVVFLEDGPMVAACEAAGAHPTVVPAGRLREIHRYAGCVARLARQFRLDRPDVVVGWMTKAQLYAGPAARLAGVPALWCQHGMPSSRSVIDRVATALPARGVIAASRAVAHAQRAVRPRRPVAVVYPGTNLDLFDGERLPPPAHARARLGLPVEGRLVGIVARLQRWKGVHVLVEALPTVVGRHPDVHCVVIGGTHELEPEYEPYLRRTVARLGLDERVIFAGAQPEVQLWLQALDVLVNASVDEPFGLSIVEAMALGKPVVAAASGGPLETIRDSVEGLLVPPGDPAGLAGALSRLLADPELAARLGSAGQQRARKFSSRGYAVRFAEAVTDLIR